ncbi:MAG: type VI secretion system baseplate subunit TssF [Planctomycetes bacterium]|nr:type VI secretion system baseplate subunit TssF [Planctomycetota bacterium]
MDERFLALFDREIGHLRKTAGEFAKAFPKIAGRLSLDEFRCDDPYVERLLEGFAFLAARAQLKLEAEFPRFTQSMLETLYPHYLAPTPSMALVQFAPDLTETGLADGQIVMPRDTVLRGLLGKHDQTRCTYRTAHEVPLWPIRLTEGQYCTRELATLEIPADLGAAAAVRLRLDATAGVAFNDIKMDELTLYLRGTGRGEMRLYEQLMAHSIGILIQSPTRPVQWRVRGGGVERVGFADREKLLPYDGRSFQGYRLVHEYFAFPERFMFVKLTGLGDGLRRCQGGQLDVVILLDKADTELENAIDASNFVLFCSPAINLFPKRTDRIQVSDRVSEFHVVPDRTRPEDFEVYQIESVTGYGATSDQERQFKSFYACGDSDAGAADGGAYYAVNREKRRWSNHDNLYGTRTSGYTGSEVFVSLVDAQAAPFSAEIRQLGVTALCTNRDLPVRMPIGVTDSDFDMETSAPVEAVRCLRKTDPSASHAEGEVAWRAISHLSLNYLSIVDDPKEGAAALRSLLLLYGHTTDAATRRQIEGVRNISSKPVVRRIVRDGRLAFARGLEITVTFDEAAFEGTGVFLLGAVLERFFAKYVSINSFTEAVVRTVDRGELMRWPITVGQRHLL